MRLLRFVLLGGSVLGAAAVLLAHHSMDASYLRAVETEVRGNVTKVEYKNPHPRFWVDVAQPGGDTVSWEFELGSVSDLPAKGWTRSTLREGDVITVAAHPAKNGSPRGSVLWVILPGGRKIENYDRWNEPFR